MQAAERPEAYRTVRQALRNAFGDPRLNYGALKWPGMKYAEGNGLDNLDNAAQEGMVMRIVRALAGETDMLLLVLLYAYREKDPMIWFSAVQPIVERLLYVFEVPEDFKISIVIRWAGRYLDEDHRKACYSNTNEQWSLALGMSQETVRETAHDIHKGLTTLRQLIESRIEAELQDRGIL